MLLSSPEKDARVKIIDFGTSEFCAPGQKLQDKFGTPYYVAPEVSRGGSHAVHCVQSQPERECSCQSRSQSAGVIALLQLKACMQPKAWTACHCCRVRRTRCAAQCLHAVFWWLSCTSVVTCRMQVLGKKGHNVQVDIWSAGVILYILL